MAKILKYQGGDPIPPSQRYRLGFTTPKPDSTGNEVWKYHTQPSVLNVDEKGFKELSDLQAKYLEYKAPLDSTYQADGYKEIDIDRVNKISPNYYTAKKAFFDKLSSYGSPIDTRSQKEIEAGVKLGENDRFGESNYRQYPKLTDSFAYNQTVGGSKDNYDKLKGVDIQTGAKFSTSDGKHIVPKSGIIYKK